MEMEGRDMEWGEDNETEADASRDVPVTTCSATSLQHQIDDIVLQQI